MKKLEGLQDDLGVLKVIGAHLTNILKHKKTMIKLHFAL